MAGAAVGVAKHGRDVRGRDNEVRGDGAGEGGAGGAGSVPDAAGERVGVERVDIMR